MGCRQYRLLHGHDLTCKNNRGLYTTSLTVVAHSGHGAHGPSALTVQLCFPLRLVITMRR